MTVWATKLVWEHQVDGIQQVIAAMQTLSAAPHNLMMLAHKTPGTNETLIILGLPDRDALSPFAGFKEIRRQNIPDGVIALVRREDEFRERYPDIHKKLLP
jgi:hypothetical protein